MSDATATAIGVAQQILKEADRSVRAATGESIFASAFDLARPALEKVVPGAFVLLPILRNVIMPMVENALTPEEYDAVIGSIMSVEQGMNAIVTAVTNEQRRVASMTDAEVDQYARQHGLYRDTGTP